MGWTAFHKKTLHKTISLILILFMKIADMVLFGLEKLFHSLANGAPLDKHQNIKNVSIYISMVKIFDHFSLILTFQICEGFSYKILFAHCVLCIEVAIILSLCLYAEKHAGLCDCGGRPGDLAHHESAAESQTLLHPQAAGAHDDQLHTK